MKLISGTSNRKLAEEIAQHLGTPLLDTNIGRFADQEINVEINESIRGEDVFVIQSTSYPTNDNLMELLVIIDALKRGSAKRITAVIPYYGYARQDRKSAPRTPISAKLVANLISVAGSDRILALDLHAAQIQGFFDIPVDHLFANILFVDDIKNRVGTENTVIVSPDIGGVMRARSVAKWCGVDLAIIDKRRPVAGISEVMNIIGNIKGKDCIIIDDIADSAGTLCNGAKALQEHGAKSIYAYASHGLFSSNAMEKIDNSAIKEIVVTNSISLVNKDYISPRIKYLSVAKILAEGIKRISNESSMSDLFLK
ncbi:MAG: ribose-phosphate pyrophosphokinase [Alphaproteobacteria bacterium]|jgi:ribose-phosphate pyrophosphokinase|nr:ribose-phosphate pyrophosphokinase [Alphaproteobacteria bacterium]